MVLTNIRLQIFFDMDTNTHTHTHTSAVLRHDPLPFVLVSKRPESAMSEGNMMLFVFSVSAFHITIVLLVLLSPCFSLRIWIVWGPYMSGSNTLQFQPWCRQSCRKHPILRK